MHLLRKNVVLDKDTDDHLNIDIGDLTSFSGLGDTHAFLSDNLFGEKMNFIIICKKVEIANDEY